MTRKGRQLDWSRQQSSQREEEGRGAPPRAPVEAPLGSLPGASQGAGVHLERQESQKTASVSVAVTSRSMPPTILLEDDDDDVRISSPRSFAQARSTGLSNRQRSRTAEGRVPSGSVGRVPNGSVGRVPNGSVPPVEHALTTEDLLELRLGPTNYDQSASRITAPVRQVPGRQAESNKPRNRNGTFTIDLTSQSYDADCILVNEFVQKKRKPVQPAQEPGPEPAKELKLTCAVCMDAMKEMTSTTCGHLFCKQCIHASIAAQKKCPICRQTLNQKQTHRIYISGSLRNP